MAKTPKLAATHFRGTGGSKILNLDLIAHEIVRDWVLEECGDNRNEAVRRIELPISTFRDFVKGTALSGEILSHAVHAIAGGDPCVFFHRHDLLDQNVRPSGQEEISRTSEASFPLRERQRMLTIALTVHGLGKQTWAAFLDSLESQAEALLAAKKSTRRK